MYGSIGGLEYEVPQSRLYCLCINVALCSTPLRCICRVIRRSSMTMKAHTYYVIFGRPPIGGKLSPSPLAAPLTVMMTRCIWCVEEILHTSKAHWLSDDNRFVAYIQFDDRHVPLEKFPLYDPAASMYSNFMQVPYPKVHRFFTPQSACC